MPRVIKVIEVDDERRGDGTEANPHRFVRRYYTLDGDVLAEHDEWKNQRDNNAPPVVWTQS